jgi:prefoldin subunit 5
MSIVGELSDIEDVKEPPDKESARSEVLVPPLTPKQSNRSSTPDTRIAVQVEREPQRRLPGMGYRVKWAFYPMCAIILISTALSLSAYFSGWLNIPGLNSEIERLEKEVDRLTVEVDKLREENDRYEQLNIELNATVTDLKTVNRDLSETTSRLEEVNQELTATNAAFVQQVEDLANQTQVYQELNDDLTQTSTELQNQLESFRTAIGQLVIQSANLYDLGDALTDATGDFEEIGQDQDVTLIALEFLFDEINGINTNLQTLNDNLVSVVSFLEDTSAGLDSSLQETTQFLANQIDNANQRVLNSLESEYRTRIVRWDCDYRDFFREYAWGNDYDITIPSSELALPLDYVARQVLDEVCFSKTDFEDYLRKNYSPITSNRIISAVTVYTGRGLEWLFNLDMNVWEDASFNCGDLNVQFDIDI